MTIHDGENHVQITSKALGILDLNHPIRKMCIRLYYSKVKQLLDCFFILAFVVMSIALDYSSLKSRKTSVLSFDKNVFIGIMYTNSVWVFFCALAGKQS